MHLEVSQKKDSIFLVNYKTSQVWHTQLLSYLVAPFICFLANLPVYNDFAYNYLLFFSLGFGSDGFLFLLHLEHLQYAFFPFGHTHISWQ